MRRRLFTLASLLLLLLCAATVALWVRSYSTRDSACSTDANRWAVYGWSEGGGIVVGWTYGGPYIGRIIAPGWRIGPGGGWAHTKNARQGSYRDAGPPLDGSLNKRFAGLGLLGGSMSGAVERNVLLPYWLPSLLLAIAPLSWTILAYRQWRRPGLGHCPACDYNLTGNTSGTCPECGTAIKPS